MDRSRDTERREFVRIKVELPVRYKFVCSDRQDSELDRLYEGATSNISAGGLLLAGRVPVLTWLPDLLMQKMLIGVTLDLRGGESLVKALTRVAWVEEIDAATQQCALGLKFREITSTDRDHVFQFVIQSMMAL